MDQRIHFGTKEEHNARREREFLALSPAERFLWFLRSFDGPRPARPTREKRVGENFILRKNGSVR